MIAGFNYNMVFDIEDSGCIEFVSRFKTAKRFLTQFKKKYNFIIAYHSTKLDDKELASIETTGLVATNNVSLKEKAFRRFVQSTDSPEVREQIISIIDVFFEETRIITAGEVNLVIDRQLIEENYHYLLFGPESLLPLADNLRRKLFISFRHRMSDFGLPTIVSAKVPVVSTHDMWIQGIFEYLNNGFPDVSLVYRNDIPKESIINIKLVPQPYDRHGFLYM